MTSQEKKKSEKRWSPRGEGDCGVNIYSYADEETMYGQVVRDNDGGWNAFAYGGVLPTPAKLGHFEEFSDAKQSVEDYFTEIK